MTDDLKLPPLPRIQVPLIEADVSLLDIKVLAQWCERTATDYARAAVLADREGRQQRMAMTDNQRTHGPDCWSWGPAHYECAVGEIEALRERIQRDEALLRQALKALEQGAWDTLRGRNAAYAIRERLGLDWEKDKG